MKTMNSSERERLKKELTNSLNQLKVEDTGFGFKVSVPNGERSVDVSLVDGIYTVKCPGFLSTYKNLGEAIDEILSTLVSRELYDNNFSVKEVHFVINSLIK